MKKTKCTEEQIAFALKQAETGASAQEVIRKLGISELNCAIDAPWLATGSITYKSEKLKFPGHFYSYRSSPIISPPGMPVPFG